MASDEFIKLMKSISGNTSDGNVKKEKKTVIDFSNSLAIIEQIAKRVETVDNSDEKQDINNSKNSKMLDNNEKYFKEVAEILTNQIEEKIISDKDGVKTVLIKEGNNKRIKKIYELKCFPITEGEFSAIAQSISMLNSKSLFLIPFFTSSGINEKSFWFEYGYIEGKTLKEMNYNHIGAESFIKLLLNLQNRLEISNIIHGDIKPSNILINGDDLFLIDFKWEILTENISDYYLRTTDILNLRYLPVKEAMQPNNKTDLYSIGIIFYELLTGENISEYGLKNNPLDLKKIKNKKYRKVIKNITELDSNKRWDSKRALKELEKNNWFSSFWNLFF